MISISFEGEYLNGKRWNGQGYDPYQNVAYSIKDGKGFVKEYNLETGEISFEYEYSNWTNKWKRKRILL